MSEPESATSAGRTSGDSGGAGGRLRKRGLPKSRRMRHDSHFVEELTTRSEVSVGRLVALAAIEPDPDQPRSNIGDLSELVQSVRNKGVLEPILVRPRPGAEDGGPALRIISGERRYRAALQAGLLEIPVIEMDVSELEALEIALIENLQRKDLTPFEEAEGFRALAEQHGYTHEQVAESVGKSRVSVTESLSLLQMSPRLRDAVHALGVHSKSLLLEVLKLEDESDQLALLERISKDGLTRADVRRQLKGHQAARKQATPRRKPYVFKFRAPDKAYSLSLSFRQSTVDEDDLIGALEAILEDLRKKRAE